MGNITKKKRVIFSSGAPGGLWWKFFAPRQQEN